MELVGQRFNDWTIVRISPPDRHRNRRVIARCERCGTEHLRVLATIRLGTSHACRSCCSTTSRTKHGGSDTPEFVAWWNMLQRCTNPTNPSFRKYGARGVAVCDRWQGPQGFAAFQADMGPRPGVGYSLDRIDGRGGYSPENCRWATIVEQNRNTSRALIIDLNGERASLAEWCERLGVPYRRTLQRIQTLGWDPARALVEPPQKRRAA